MFAQSSIARGKKLRIVHGPGLHRNEAWLDRARRQAGAGVDVRLARRIQATPLLIVDDAVVALPLSDADPAAGVLTVHDQTITSLINALAGQVWSETCALDAAISPQGGGLSADEAALLRLVGSGLTDEAAARRLGLSLRTVARMMSRIMDRLNASSRFQAGMRAQNLGWLDGLDEISMKEAAAPHSECQQFGLA